MIKGIDKPEYCKKLSQYDGDAYAGYRFEM